MILLILVGLLAALILFVMGLQQLTSQSSRQRIIVSAVTSDSGEARGFDRWSRSFDRSRFGRYLVRELAQAGISTPPLVVFLAVVGASIIVPVVFWNLLAPAFGVVALASGWLGLRFWLNNVRTRRREAFIQQVPELARVLANATNAGLSIRTAWITAEAELSEPAKSEIARINSAVRFGASLDDAMIEILDRLPSREVRVLMSTLVVASRSGGSLVKALRDISLTLDDRKEVRRDIRTTLAQSKSTGYLIIVMGFGLLLMLNMLFPGAVERMTTNIFGQIALAVAGILFTVGFLLIRRLTRIDI